MFSNTTNASFPTAECLTSVKKLLNNGGRCQDLYVKLGSTSTYMTTLEGPLHGGAVEYIVKNDNQLVQFAATAIFNEENYKSQGPSLSNC